MKTLLVANRGEIACRVMRTARAMGLRCVAVHSDADARARHVREADAAVPIGPAPAARSYLNIDALLAAARTSGADAVHPGYGFLSENADFAQACLDAGLTWVGPPPSAMRAMADKAAAKRRMLEAGVPCVPGYLGDDQGPERLAAEARRIGFPLLVKAVAGGGGRGMRLVHAENEMTAALAGARREAEAAFGDGRLMLERLIDDARHIEVQVFADTHGLVIHLGERDCSVQRRRQKVIEEAPSPTIDAAQRAAMGRDAVAAARAVGYVGAGTVEFIVDTQGRHHFLEMNTRLQVEHPVTEGQTGLDLVEWQLRIAAGEPLPLAQDEVRYAGHTIEARLYAEDPHDGFAPQTGTVRHWRPTPMAGLRVDAGIAEGDFVTPHYDGLLAKLIAHGRDRVEATRRLMAALKAMPLLGVTTNAGFLRTLLAGDAWATAALTTATLDREATPRPTAPAPAWALAAAVRARADRPALRPAWARPRTLRLVAHYETREVELPHAVHIDRRADRTVHATIDGHTFIATVLDDGDTLHLALDGQVHTFHEPSPWPADRAGGDAAKARAPVAGVVAQVLVAPGDTVTAGQPLASVEAMKMEMWLHARADGTVRAVHARAQQPVAAGAVLIEMEP